MTHEQAGAPHDQAESDRQQGGPGVRREQDAPGGHERHDHDPPGHDPREPQDRRAAEQDRGVVGHLGGTMGHMVPASRPSKANAAPGAISAPSRTEATITRRHTT